MNATNPPPGIGTEAEKQKIRRVIEARNLVGAANDTKWGVLLDAMRSRDGWRPSYRCKCVDSPPSGWDAEWWYHLPLPMLSVEWLDISLVQKVHRGQLISPELTNHRDWIIPVLEDAGLCYEISGDIVRIFGYLPKNYEGFLDGRPT